MPKMHEHTKQVHLCENTIRTMIAILVQIIYTSWGMSDYKFCTLMSEELKMSRERVYKFLCQDCRIHEELTYDNLSYILDAIFTKHVSDEQLIKFYNSNRELFTEKMSNLYKALDVIKKYKATFLTVLNEDFQNLYYVVHFLDGSWPENNSGRDGLSSEESQKLKDALENVISKPDMKKLRNKLNDMEQTITGLPES